MRHGKRSLRAVHAPSDSTWTARCGTRTRWTTGALVLPGGVANADKLRTEGTTVAFAQRTFRLGKPTAVICRGPWLLAGADVVRGRVLTSWPSTHTTLTIDGQAANCPGENSSSRCTKGFHQLQVSYKYLRRARAGESSTQFDNAPNQVVQATYRAPLSVCARGILARQAGHRRVRPALTQQSVWVVMDVAVVPMGELAADVIAD